MKELTDDVLKEKELLEGLGFQITAVQSIEDVLDEIEGSFYYIRSYYSIHLNNEMVGSCNFFHRAGFYGKRNTLVITYILNKNYIPEEKTKQLVLLGYEEEGDDWLQREKEIE